MNYDFSIGKVSKPIVMITKYCFKFNKEAIELLDAPKFIAIGLDRDAKKLAFKAVDKKCGNEPAYPFASDFSKTRAVTVSATAVRRAVIELMDEKPEAKGVCFVLETEQDTKYGVIYFAKNK